MIDNFLHYIISCISTFKNEIHFFEQRDLSQKDLKMARASTNTEEIMALSRNDPPKYGWSLLGGMVDLLTPHERARRREGKQLAVANMVQLQRDSRFSEDNNNNPFDLMPIDHNCSSKTDVNQLRLNKYLHDPMVKGKFLDIKQYHRGRIGSEPRDGTLELLHDIAQDTKHKWDPATTVPHVEIRFPLSEDSDYDEDSNDGKKCELSLNDGESEVPKESVGLGSDSNLPGLSLMPNEFQSSIIEPVGKLKHYFQEEIQWNLSEMPTPAEFAMNIALEYGLTKIETLTLERDINHQLQQYLLTTSSFLPCVTLNDATGKKRNLSSLNASAENKRSKAFATFGCEERVHIQIDQDRQRANNIGFDVVAFDSKDDKNYISEVQRRLRNASVQKNASILEAESANCQIEPRMEYVENATCHVCRVAKPHGVRFSCQLESHVFCDYHCQTRLGFGAQSDVRRINCTSEGANLFLSAQRKENADECVKYFNVCCPICALICTCAKCNKKLEKIAKELKSRCIECNAFLNFDGNEVAAMMNVELDVWSLSVGASAIACFAGDAGDGKECFTAKESSGRRVNNRTSQRSQNGRSATTAKLMKDKNLSELMVGLTKSSVPKVSVRNLPLEVPPDWSRGDKTKKKGKKENKFFSNVTYCMHCLEGVNLLSCIKCPRSFHAKCMKALSSDDEEPEQTDDRSDKKSNSWICPCCIQRDNDSNDAVPIFTGKKLLPSLKDTYCEKYKLSDDISKLRTLSKLHELVNGMIKYDFGYIFKKPVTKRECPDYTKVISEPMDLSTIMDNIANGKYVETINENKNNEIKSLTTEVNELEEATCNLWDKVILSALKHIELMYHNCKLYNAEGSAVSRMCDVQRMQYLRVRRANIEAGLTDQIRKSLEEFVLENQERRKKQSMVPKASELPLFISVASKETFTPSESIENSFVIRKVNSKLPVATAVTRSVIIIDPNTNTIVRYYSTQKLAMKACFQMVDRGHQVGIAPLTEYQWRKIMKAANLDASVLMFGYRWLVYEDVLNGQVVFPGFVDKIYRDETLSNGTSVEEEKVGPVVVKEDCNTGIKISSFDSIEAAYMDFLEVFKDTNDNITGCTEEAPDNRVGELQMCDIGAFESQYIYGTRKLCDKKWSLVSIAPSESRNQVLRERSVNWRSSNSWKQKQVDFPKPKENHCHAYISLRKQYCKRKIVDGSNYCMIHMKQMMQGNVANSVIFASEMKGSLPSGRKKYTKQGNSASVISGAIVVDGKVNSKSASVPGSDVSDENNNDPIICSMLEMPLIQNMCFDYSHGHIDAVANSIFTLTGAINTSSIATTSSASTQAQKFSSSIKTTGNLEDSNKNEDEVVLSGDDFWNFESICDINESSFQIPSLPPMALSVPCLSSEAIIAISLSTQTVMGRWNSVFSASNDVGISSTKLRRIINNKEPMGDIFYSGASHEHGILAKLREIVERKKGSCTAAI